MLLVALLGVQALVFNIDEVGEEKDGQEITTEADMVSTFIDSYDMHCWQSHCLDQCTSCAEDVPKCRDHFFCPFSPAECFHNVRWADLAPEEVKVFDCAKDHGCAPHKAASFIEVAMRVEHGAAAAAAKEAGAPSPAEAVQAARLAAAGKQAAPARAAGPTPVLESTMSHIKDDIQRALVSVADHAAFVTKARDSVTSIESRLGKLYQIKHPTAADEAELMDLIRQMSVVHDAQEQQFNEFSREGASSMLETGSAEPSTLYHVLARMADFHAPAEAVEAFLSGIMGLRGHPSISSHLEFDGNTDFHHADQHPDAESAASPSQDTQGNQTEAAESAASPSQDTQGNQTDAAESAATPGQDKRAGAAESQKQQAAAAESAKQQQQQQQQQQQAEEARAQAVEAEQQEVQADEAEFSAGTDEAADELKDYDKNKDKDLQALHASFQGMRDSMAGLEDTFEGNTTGMTNLEKMQHLTDRVTPSGPLPDSFVEGKTKQVEYLSVDPSGNLRLHD